MIEERRWGTNPLVETRAIANEMADRVNIPMHILEILSESKESMTAREIAIEMKTKGYTLSDDRQAVAPRITEMMRKGILENNGVKMCEVTGRPVGVFRIRERGKENV